MTTRSTVSPPPMMVQGLAIACCLGFSALLVSCGASSTENEASEEGAEVSTSSSDLAVAERPTTSMAPRSTESGANATTATPPQADSSTSTTTSTSVPPSTESAPAQPETTAEPPPSGSETTSVPFDGAIDGSINDAEQTVRIRFESKVGDVSVDELSNEALTILNDARGWPRAGFRFVADDASPFRVVLAEGDQVDALCLPLVTYGTVSCQNGPVVALNATRWRSAVEHWDAGVADYRGYLINHEVGHLLGMRHPKPRCPIDGRPAGVMEQQTAGLEGCVGNAWPRDWEIEQASARPVVYAPLPDWGPEPVPANGES